MGDILPTQADFSALLKVAEAAAKAAGAYLLQRTGSATIEYEKALHDDLLDVDLEAERIILTRLQIETPDIGILSEEAGQKKAYPNYWIVDPLDGSANFQHGSPLFAIAIALVMNETTVGGVIHLPAQNENYLSSRFFCCRQDFRGGMPKSGRC